ncbi:glucosidase family protein [Botryobacter ruber]|uniref:hypothetical protein n=1 Tax=Botryobacter ruber TaxID=2171629 RepID=UPI000E0B935D|nr:hypothetical protein [Botryobacter ruber]
MTTTKSKNISGWCSHLFLFFFIGINSFIVSDAAAQSPATDNRWKINPDGSITWAIDKRIPHNDHIEMSGERMSTIVRYGVNADGSFTVTRNFVWPMLRFMPNKTRNHLARTSDWNILTTIHANGAPLSDEKVSEVTLNGLMQVKSKVKQGLEFTRTLYPSPTQPVFLEKYTLTNTSDKPLSVEIPQYQNSFTTESGNAIYGAYTVTYKSIGGGSFTLEPGKSVLFGALFGATKSGESIANVQLDEEEKQRIALVSQWKNNLVLETPDQTLNQAFAFAKIRGSESIYRTKGGLMHGPGGGAYYAAVWANDQAEYIGPFFPFLGYNIGNEASMNAYKHFARFMNPDYKAIPSSIIAEGEGIWHGAKDRGDGAMIAYGAARYALASGNKKEAEELWPLIEWTLEFCRRKLTPEGVVASDSDELENRFPAGKANLSTSSLYYDALLSASYLGKDLGVPARKLAAYRTQAQELKTNMEKYFGGKVEGFDTYKYYETNDVLRAWICIPLTMDIYDRKKGTIDALFSPRLWTADGLSTQAGKETFWDRSTLYALRGVFAAGEKEKALEFLKYYSNRRLLGDHVPYPVEAYPEGNQRHLSAESGLYCRIFTEGLFGIRPTGLKSFRITPHLPDQWNQMALKKVHAFDAELDIQVKREKDKIRLTAYNGNKRVYNSLIKDGQSVEIKL